MPWLIKDALPSERLFFIHVPRCGGTSLMHHFDVPTKVMKGRSCWGKFGMRTFFHRYKLLETNNFPIVTPVNGFIFFVLLGSIPLFIFGFILFGVIDLVLTTIILVSLCFVFTAPAIGRSVWVRRFFLILVQYILCGFMESIEWVTGTNKTGYMMHLTAQKILNYGYVTEEDFMEANTMAIVRNPYARMVSIFMYNRNGGLESFDKFMKDWYKISKPYRDRREMEEWYIPCHAIPQFEYTHYNGRQLVQSIVKQEELKLLKTKESEHLAMEQDSSVRELPDTVRNALLGMPHTNKRNTKKKWYDYYTQETLDLCYEMYQNDFVVFKYSPAIEQRPDLKSPVLPESAPGIQKMLRDSNRLPEAEQLRRKESISSLGLGQSMIRSIAGSETFNDTLRSNPGAELLESTKSRNHPRVSIPEGSDEEDSGNKLNGLSLEVEVPVVDVEENIPESAQSDQKEDKKDDNLQEENHVNGSVEIIDRSASGLDKVQDNNNNTQENPSDTSA